MKTVKYDWKFRFAPPPPVPVSHSMRSQTISRASRAKTTRSRTPGTKPQVRGFQWSGGDAASPQPAPAGRHLPGGPRPRRAALSPRPRPARWLTACFLHLLVRKSRNTKKSTRKERLLRPVISLVSRQAAPVRSGALRGRQPRHSGTEADRPPQGDPAAQRPGRPSPPPGPRAALADPHPAGPLQHHRGPDGRRARVRPRGGGGRPPRPGLRPRQARRGAARPLRRPRTNGAAGRGPGGAGPRSHPRAGLPALRKPRTHRAPAQRTPARRRPPPPAPARPPPAAAARVRAPGRAAPVAGAQRRLGSPPPPGALIPYAARRLPIGRSRVARGAGLPRNGEGGGGVGKHPGRAGVTTGHPPRWAGRACGADRWRREGRGRALPAPVPRRAVPRRLMSPAAPFRACASLCLRALRPALPPLWGAGPQPAGRLWPWGGLRGWARRPRSRPLEVTRSPPAWIRVSVFPVKTPVNYL